MSYPLAMSLGWTECTRHIACRQVKSHDRWTDRQTEGLTDMNVDGNSLHIDAVRVIIIKWSINKEHHLSTPTQQLWNVLKKKVQTEKVRICIPQSSVAHSTAEVQVQATKAKSIWAWAYVLLMYRPILYVIMTLDMVSMTNATDIPFV